MAFLPLQGIRVLAVEQVMAGPYCSKLLADLGAEVIKVENPGTGDIGRHVGPIARSQDGVSRSVFFVRANPNKKSVTLNLKTAEAREILYQLVKRSDIFVVNQTPRVLRKLGIDYATLRGLNPGIVYVCITGFGLPGTESDTDADRKAFDIVIQAMSGLSKIIEGEGTKKPEWVNTPIADLYAGVFGCLGALAALIEKQRTGEGRLVDVSMYEVLTSLNERWLTTYSVLKEKIEKGVGHGASSPWDIFQVKDGYVAIGSAADGMWPQLCEIIGRPDLATNPDFVPAVTRAHNHQRVKEIIETWARDKTRAQVEEFLSSAGVAVGPVQDVEELFHCPILRRRGLWQTMHDPVLGTIELIGNPLHYSDEERGELARSPELGEHTAEVLSEILDMDATGIEALRRRGVV